MNSKAQMVFWPWLQLQRWISCNNSSDFYDIDVSHCPRGLPPVFLFKDQQHTRLLKPKRPCSRSSSFWITKVIRLELSSVFGGNCFPPGVSHKWVVGKAPLDLELGYQSRLNHRTGRISLHRITFRNQKHHRILTPDYPWIRDRCSSCRNHGRE